MHEVKIITYDNRLLILAVPLSFKLVYIAFILILLVAIAGVFFLTTFLQIVLVVILITIISSYWHRLSLPGNFFSKEIRTQGNMVIVGRKKFAIEDLLFLSFNEQEACTIIRLEAKRNNILFPKQSELISNCSGFEEAVSLCRQIRSFIDPALKINYKRMASGKTSYTDGSGGSASFETWDWIED